jgi:hypothetical protein
MGLGFEKDCGVPFLVAQVANQTNLLCQASDLFGRRCFPSNADGTPLKSWRSTRKKLYRKDGRGDGTANVLLLSVALLGCIPGAGQNGAPARWTRRNLFSFFCQFNESSRPKLNLILECPRAQLDVVYAWPPMRDSGNQDGGARLVRGSAQRSNRFRYIRTHSLYIFLFSTSDLC